MKIKRNTVCWFIVLIAGIVCISVLLWQLHAPSFRISVGIPKSADGKEVSAVDYTEARPISDKERVDQVIFSLLYGRAIPASSVPDTAPDGMLMMGGQRKELAHSFPVWIDGDTVIYSLKDGEETEYRRVDDADFAAYLNELLGGEA